MPNSLLKRAAKVARPAKEFLHQRSTRDRPTAAVSDAEAAALRAAPTLD
jgi:hypothetical protein